MVKRKSSLADAVHGAARADKRIRSKVSSQSDTGVTKGVFLRLPVDLHRKLRQLALDEDTSLQVLGLEALEQILDKRRR